MHFGCCPAIWSEVCLWQPFNKKEKMAGEAWLNGFMARHPEILLRKTESTLAAHAISFNKVAASDFFSLLK
jgi:hypothetical protein